jgi:putative ATPase
MIDLKIAEQAVQKKAIFYDKKGDWHYDTISAFIKSMRGNSPDGALYWLARMIKAGEDPIFIARRMVIFASEDIGNAQPTALVVAANCMQAVHMIGMPEAGIILAQVTTYLATSKKSRASYNGLNMALADIDEKRLEPVPLQLRNASTKLMKDLGFGKGYAWTDETEFHKEIEFLPKNLKNRHYYKEKK